jgi:L-amino acid N-acyltransferase YncA
LDKGEALVVRSAEEDDMPAVAAIFAPYVTKTLITFELQPPSAQDWRVRVGAYVEVRSRGEERFGASSCEADRP